MADQNKLRTLGLIILVLTAIMFGNRIQNESLEASKKFEGSFRDIVRRQDSVAIKNGINTEREVEVEAPERCLQDGVTTAAGRNTAIDPICSCLHSTGASSWALSESSSIQSATKSAASASATATTLPVAVWNRLKPKILEAATDSLPLCWTWKGALDSLNMADFQKLIESTFSALTSPRLKKSLKVPPNPLTMERVLQVILRRLADPVNNPPLRIAVLGGSVTEGCWSARNSLGLHNLDFRCPKGCAWPAKLEMLLNKILSGGGNNNTNTTVVDIQNYAVAGTDSDIGSVFLEMRMFEKKSKYTGSDFDIFISAYSSNDGQVSDEQRESLFESMQRFLRTCMDQRPCSDLPLVIQLEDNMLDTFHGDNVRRGVWWSTQMGEIASWANIMTVSYPDATRDFVYSRNASDITVTEYGELHPGVTFQTGVAWVLAYNLLAGLMDSCDGKLLPEYYHKEPRLGFPPPILTNHLKSHSVNEAWKQYSTQKTKLCAKGKTAGTVCVHKWMASKLDVRTKKQVYQEVSAVATNIQGWVADGFEVKKPRRTWLANGGPNSTFTIQVNNTPATPINQMMVLYLRSYGEKWENSRLLVVVEGKSQNEHFESGWTELHRVILEGSHNSRTSINYAYRTELGAFFKETPESIARVTFTLIEGTTFQINGIALCHLEKLLSDASGSVS